MEKGIKQVYTALGIELIRCFVSDKKTGRFLNRERLGRLPKTKSRASVFISLRIAHGVNLFVSSQKFGHAKMFQT